MRDLTRISRQARSRAVRTSAETPELPTPAWNRAAGPGPGNSTLLRRARLTRRSRCAPCLREKVRSDPRAAARAAPVPGTEQREEREAGTPTHSSRRGQRFPRARDHPGPRLQGRLCSVPRAEPGLGPPPQPAQRTPEGGTSDTPTPNTLPAAAGQRRPRQQQSRRGRAAHPPPRKETRPGRAGPLPARPRSAAAAAPRRAARTGRGHM